MALHLLSMLHVVAGTVVLAVAPAAMLARKGGTWHRRWGIAFTAGMALVLISAAWMWQPHGHVFLLYLDVVCAYLIYGGWRTLARRRRRVRDARADALDVVAVVAVFASIVAIVEVSLRGRTALMRELAVFLIAIAAIAAAFAALDLRAIRAGTQSRPGALLVHLAAMIGAYVSAVTAFCVINLHATPMALRWLVPSAAGTLVISVFSARVRLQAARTKRAQSARAVSVTAATPGTPTPSCVSALPK